MIKRASIVAAAIAAAFFLVVQFGTPSRVDQASVDALLHDPRTEKIQNHEHHSGEAKNTTSDAADKSPQIDEFLLGLDDRKHAMLQSLRDRLRQAQQNPGNLQAFFNALAQHCKGAACSTLLAEILSEYPDKSFAELVTNIHTRMPYYESAMHATLMSMETPAQTRFQQIQELRIQTLGHAETEAMFGQEAAWADYQFRYAELMQRAAALSPDERLDALDSLRDSSFGDYQERLRQIEGAQGAYERELALLLVDIEDDRDRAEVTHRLRVAHFGDTQAEILAHRDARAQQQEARATDYRSSLESLKKELAPLQKQLPADEWTLLYEDRLEQLRLEYFPPDS